MGCFSILWEANQAREALTKPAPMNSVHFVSSSCTRRDWLSSVIYSTITSHFEGELAKKDASQCPNLVADLDAWSRRSHLRDLGLRFVLRWPRADNAEVSSSGFPMRSMLALATKAFPNGGLCKDPSAVPAAASTILLEENIKKKRKRTVHT